MATQVTPTVTIMTTQRGFEIDIRH